MLVELFFQYSRSLQVNTIKKIFAVLLMLTALPIFAQGFLSSPLSCGDPSCTFAYTQGVYTAGIMNTVLDHSLKQNSAGGFWQFGTISSGGGNGVIVAFNGEIASGSPKPGDQVCIGGTILLKPTPGSPASTAMTNTSGCGTGYTSYDEHPGYDYRATMSTPVKAAASGYVVNINGTRCINTNLPSGCGAWGYIGIDHGNGYITQYGHLSQIYYGAGSYITEGQIIGLSGHTAAPGYSIGAHLHFEVLKLVNGQYYVVDPYGWVGVGGAPSIVLHLFLQQSSGSNLFSSIKDSNSCGVFLLF